MTIKTNTKYNFSEAEDEKFSWNTWDGTSGKILTHKASGRQIYQMCWLDAEGYKAGKVEGKISEQVKSFWAELEQLRTQKPPTDDYVDPEPKHGENGYCRKCHSYCYGDCSS